MILVAGPPCGGKTTYVRNHALPEDKTLDYDDIIEELGATRYTRDPHVMAQAQCLWIERMPSTTWAILTAPRRSERGRFRAMHHASVVVVMAPMDICLERAASERPLPWQDAIRRWFALWQPSTSGREMIVRTDA